MRVPAGSAAAVVAPYLLPAPRLPPTVLTAPLPPSKMAAERELLLPYPKWPPAVAAARPTLPERKMAAGAAARGWLRCTGAPRESERASLSRDAEAWPTAGERKNPPAPAAAPGGARAALPGRARPLPAVGGLNAWGRRGARSSRGSSSIPVSRRAGESSALSSWGES